MDAHDVTQIVNSVKYDGPERSVFDSFRMTTCLVPAAAPVVSSLKLVAVGTALASGPPHGSVREEFPHTALTSGSSDGQPLVGIEMQNARGRKPVANQSCHVLP